MTDNEKLYRVEDKKRENTKLLATIIFSLLLAMAFLSEYSDALGDIEAIIFILGIVALFFSYICFIHPKIKIWTSLSYFFALGFMGFLIQKFSGGMALFTEKIPNLLDFRSTLITIILWLSFLIILLISEFSEKRKFKQLNKH